MCNTRHARQLLLALAVTAMASGFAWPAHRARAHGGPPAALGMLAVDATQRPELVLLNEGLAQRGPRQDWSFLCPSLWGDHDIATGKSPLAIASDARASRVGSWVIGSDDLYLAYGGVFEPQGRPTLSRSFVIALQTHGHSALALRLTAVGSEVVDLGAPSDPPLVRMSEVFSTLASDGAQLYLARPDSEVGLVIAAVRAGGEVEQERHLPTERPVASMRLRAIEGVVYAVLFDGAQYSLGRFDEEDREQPWEVVLRSPGPIHGPLVGPGEQVWLAVDGTLMQATSDGFVSSGETRPVTCLERSGPLPYACVGTDLYALDEHGLGARVFELDGLYPPLAELVPDAAVSTCDIQWSLFRSDLQQSGLSAGSWQEEPEPLPGAEPAPRDDAPQDAGAPSDAQASSDAGASPSARASRPASCQITPAPASTAFLHALLSLFGVLGVLGVLGVHRRAVRGRRNTLLLRSGNWPWERGSGYAHAKQSQKPLS